MDNLLDLDSLRVAFSNMITQGIELIPKLVIAIIILIIGRFLAKLVAKVVKTIADKINLEGILESTGISGILDQANIEGGGTGIIAQLMYWMVFLNFILIALGYIGLNDAVVPLERFINFLPRVLVGIVMLLGGAMLSQFVGKIVSASLASSGVEIHEALGNLVRMILLVIVFILVVTQLGMDAVLLNSTFVNILTIGFAGLALAFGLGGRGVARGVLAGFYAREMFNEGDTLLIDGQEGKLIGIGSLNAEIQTADGRFVVPNTRLTEDSVGVRH